MEVFLAQSAFGKALREENMALPHPSPSRETEGDLPYCLVGDEGFPLHAYLIRTYPGKGLSEERHIFNYRLSRARRTIENAFGIFAAT